jgi:hypothetical protein
MRVISASRASLVCWWYQRARAWWRRVQADQCAVRPGGDGAGEQPPGFGDGQRDRSRIPGRLLVRPDRSWGLGISISKNHAMNTAKVSTLLNVLLSHGGPQGTKTGAVSAPICVTPAGGRYGTGSRCRRDGCRVPRSGATRPGRRPRIVPRMPAQPGMQKPGQLVTGLLLAAHPAVSIPLGHSDIWRPR